MRQRAPVILVFAALAISLVASHLHAQSTAPAPAFLRTATQLRALVDASANGGYIPGETLVKFREGTASADQTRALSTLRRGTTGSSRWIGTDVLLISTPDDGDAAAIAATLGRQPEIEWAQPNYVRKRKLRPNDPAYNLQWNLNLINLPAAWDINRGAAASVTVALVDSGVNTAATTPTLYQYPNSMFVPTRYSA